MKTTKITLIAIATLIIAACSSSKKSTSSTAATSPASTSVTSTPTTSNSTPSIAIVEKPANGIYAPGNEELVAIQAQYKDVTSEKLKEGHTIYTQGACINCHGAKNIYKRGETQWKDIIEDMAHKAQITDDQKDAVYKYVLAIKATQPKAGK